jgi:hypothetical protein
MGNYYIGFYKGKESGQKCSADKRKGSSEFAERTQAHAEG